MVTPRPYLHRPHPTRLRRATFSRRGREKERAAKLEAIKVAMAVGDLPQTINFAVKSAIVASFLESNV